jgi:uncharacterized hydrophobic protein (TIGR00271 family)
MILLRDTILKILKSLNLADEQKEEVAKRIVNEAKGGGIYWLQVISSNTIAVLGLLINSIPVVIGAMLIAPLMGPIQGLAFAIASGNKGLLWKSSKLLFLTVLVCVINSFVISFVVPFTEITEEIEARTNPTFIDICIAIASGIIAFSSIAFSKEFGTSISGVAMAASLMPPLAVIGVGVELGQIVKIAQGSSLLFLANLVAIIIVGSVMLRAFGFVTTNEERRGFSTRNFIFVSLSALAVSMPLFSSMFVIASDLEARHKIEESLKQTVPAINNKMKVVHFDFQSGQSEAVDIDVEIYIPQDFRLTTAHQNLISESLSSALQKSVNLDIFILPLIEVFSEVEKDQKTDEEIFQEQVENFLDNKYPQAEIYQFKVITTGGKEIIQMGVYSEEEMNKEEFRETFREVFKSRIEKEDSSSILIIDWEGLPEQTIKDNDIEDIDPVILGITAEFQELFPDSNLLNLSIPNSLEPPAEDSEQKKSENEGEELNQDSKVSHDRKNTLDENQEDAGEADHDDANTEDEKQQNQDMQNQEKTSNNSNNNESLDSEEAENNNYRPILINLEFSTSLDKEETRERLKLLKNRAEEIAEKPVEIYANVNYFDNFIIKDNLNK